MNAPHWQRLRRFLPGRHWPLSAMVVAGLGLGVSVLVGFAAMQQTLGGQDIPAHADGLYSVQLRSIPVESDPLRAWRLEPGLVDVLSYPDVTALLKSTIPELQAPSVAAQLYGGLPSMPAMPLKARFCTQDFFSMFGVRLMYGGLWTSDQEHAGADVVIISQRLNQDLFGGRNSVGQWLEIEGRMMRVVGVMAPFQPVPRYYDLSFRFFETAEPVMVPLALFRTLRAPPSEIVLAWQPHPEGHEALLASSNGFMQLWVRLPSAQHVENYRAFLAAFRPHAARPEWMLTKGGNILSLADYLASKGVPPRESTTMVVLSALFGTACAINLVGFLLARFLSHSKEVEIRRALGATRWSIFFRHIRQCLGLGLLGGLLSIPMAGGLMAACNRLFPVLSNIFHMTAQAAVGAVGTALLLSILAGFYPSLMMSRLRPAQRIKLQ